MLFYLLGCSLGIPEYSLCTDHDQCASSFGVNYTCGSEGYCEAFSRCPVTYPEDVFENWDDYKDGYVMGSLFNHESNQSNILAASFAIKQVREIDSSKNFSIIHCDYGTQDDGLASEEAAVFVGKHLNKYAGVEAVIGPSSSAASKILFNSTEDEDLFIISPSATAEELSTIDNVVNSDADPGRFWRTVSSDEVQSKVLYNIISSSTDPTIDKLLLIYESDAYGRGFYESLSAQFDSSQIGFISFDGSNLGQSKENWSNIADSVEPSNFDVYDIDGIVFISSDLETIKEFVGTVSELDVYQNKYFFFADGAADTEFLELESMFQRMGATVAGSRPLLIRDNNFSVFSSEFDFFVQGDPVKFSEYKEVSAESDVYVSYTYDATWLTLYGYLWSSFNEVEISSAGLSRGIRRLVGGDLLEIGPSTWGAVRNAFEIQQEVDIHGISGALDYDLATGELVGAFEVWRPNGDYSCFQVWSQCLGTTDNLNCIPVTDDTCLD